MKDLYADSITGLDCKTVAIMIDIYFFGPTVPTFNAFARFCSILDSRSTGLKVNLPKTLA